MLICLKITWLIIFKGQKYAINTRTSRKIAYEYVSFQQKMQLDTILLL